MLTSLSEATLDDVCTRITDGAHHSPKTVEEGLPMASVKDLTRHGVNLSTCRLISASDFDKLVRQGCRPERGDVLIAKDGASSLDTVCLVKEELSVVLLSSVAILRPDQSKVLPAYLRYWLDAESTRRYMKNAFTTGAAIPRVVLQDFKRALIMVPPLLVQRKIAAILSAFDELIENNLRRIEILEEMAQLVYREWFIAFRFPGHEKVRMVDSPLGKLPEGWTITTVGDVFQIMGGGTPSKMVKEYWDGGTVTWYVPSDLTKAGTMFMEDSSLRITELGLKKSSAKLFPTYSVMMTSRATLGVVAINTTPACTNQGFIVCIPNERIPLYFLYHWVLENTPTFLNMATGATFKEISKAVFRTIELTLPPQNLVKEFKGIVERLANQILNLQRMNSNLRRTRDLLLPRLISGELDVSGLDIDTEVIDT